MEAVFGWVAQYGSIALFFLLMLGIVGLPIPDETLLVFSGYMIFKGNFHPLTTLIAAFLGSACGITVSYWLGRTFGLTLMHRYGRLFHITDEQLHRVHDWFERAGRWTLAIGYYIPGVRHFTAVVAGTSELAFHEFAIFAYGGAFIWVSSFLTLGYFIGDGWERASEQAHHYLLIASVAIGSLLLCYFLFRKWRRR